MMALVRGVIAASIAVTSVISVSRSTSTNTGVAPSRVIMLAVETQVCDGVMTSSPGPTPNASRVICIPPVAEESATACRQPT
ncbi:hypothetical protein D3C75_1011540 [compost metagenome]